MEVVNVSSLLA